MADRAMTALIHLVRHLVILAVACAVAVVVVPTAAADDLTDHRDRVQQQLRQTRADLDESSTQLSTTAGAVRDAQHRLGGAQVQLARTRRELSEARSSDQATAARLRRARAALVRARAAVVVAQRNLAAEKVLAGTMARDQYQQQTNLLPIALLVSSRSTADLQTRLQWSTTMFDTTGAQIDRLTQRRDTLGLAKARQAEAEARIAVDRRITAQNLVTKKRLERRATTQTATIARLVRQRTAAQAAAQRAVTADRRQYVALTRERSSVEQRIAVRIAQAKAAEARRVAAARAARTAAQQRARLAAQLAHARAVARAKAVRAAARHRARVAERRAAAAQRAHRLGEARRIRRAAARARAAEHAREVRRAARDRQAARHRHRHRSAQRVRHRPAHHSTGSRSRSSGGGAHHGFSYPVHGPITSPYGRRFHPIRHIWKLHDGTDFGAGCGTPIRAAYGGRVAERYRSGAYGNRLMIDHGRVDGRFVTTGYNHAQRYVVHVGQHVHQGQVVGYVGATGYATGCHLHLMVWLNGHRTNPMRWF